MISFPAWKVSAFVLTFFEIQEEKKVKIRQENKRLLTTARDIFYFLNGHKITNFYPTFISNSKATNKAKSSYSFYEILQKKMA